MLTGFIGLGAVVETAYLPALRTIFGDALRCTGFDVQPARQPAGIARCASLPELLAQPLDILFITTASLQHLGVLEQVLQSAVPRIVVEKPVVATLSQIQRLKLLLASPSAASRVLALDHWMARTQAATCIAGTSDIVKIEGFLQEPSGLNAAGEPIALNFASGEPDTRTLRHPDGVILDIGTHVLAMLRETLHLIGGSDDMALRALAAKDRLGREIAKGDVVTAEGEAHLQGQISGVPVNIWLNKYAGPAGGQKGLRIYLRSGDIINYDRRGAEDLLEHSADGKLQRRSIPGTIYARCLTEAVFGNHSLFERGPHEVSRATQRRIQEVELLLTLQQQLRGPH